VRGGESPSLDGCFQLRRTERRQLELGASLNAALCTTTPMVTLGDVSAAMQQVLPGEGIWLNSPRTCRGGRRF
jgi:hypothetical protein